MTETVQGEASGVRVQACAASEGGERLVEREVIQEAHPRRVLRMCSTTPACFIDVNLTQVGCDPWADRRLPRRANEVCSPARPRGCPASKHVEDHRERHLKTARGGVHQALERARPRDLARARTLRFFTLRE